METPDQYVHRAIESDRAVAGASADGSLTPLFPAQATPTGLPPRTPPSGRPLDRVRVAPQPPSGGFSPPVPQGRRGEIRLPYLSTTTP
jgi:hypothetical protein